MKIQTSIYVPAKSPVHTCDARVKIVLLFAFTICVFLVDNWAGIGTFALLTLLAIAASRVPARRYFSVLLPVYVLMAFSILCNMFVGGDALVSFGAVSICASGLSRGCFLALRMLMLCLASMVLSFTTTSTELTAALCRIMGPLRNVRVPVDDIATVFSIALRFIPLLARETEQVRDAQWCRGARFDGGLGGKLRAWGNVFMRVLVRLFRKADSLSASMDARGYGMPGVRRTAMGAASLSAGSAACLVCGLALVVAVAILF